MESNEEWVRRIYANMGNEVPRDVLYAARQYDKPIMPAMGRPLTPRVRREIANILRSG